jgi:hypothetical protein
MIVTLLTASALVAACGTPPPAAIAPTFEAWSTIGLSCSGPARGNEPTTLVQWSCQGTVEGTGLTVIVDGDDRGINDFVAQVAAGAPDSAAVASFRALIGASPYLSGGRDQIDAWLLGLEGLGEYTNRIGGRYVHVVRDPIWVTLAVATVS